MSIESNPGAALRARREALGLTQEQLAERIGVHRTHIVHIEAGRRRATLDIAVALRRELGLDESVWARDRREAVPA